MKRAFFLDRDGTLNVDYDYVHRPDQWTWCEQAVESIRWMNQNNWLVVVVTNQSGVMRGKYGMKEVQELHHWVDAELEKYQAQVDRWYVAPFHPQFHEGLDPDLLRYRKPGTGMFELARKELGIDFSQSVMAGDKISDLEPALQLGIRPFYIRSAHHAKQAPGWFTTYKIPAFDHLGHIIPLLNS